MKRSIACLSIGLLSYGVFAIPPQATFTPTLSLNTTILQASGDWLQVAWADVVNASCTDFLALLPASYFFGGESAQGVLTTSPAKLAPTNGTSDGAVRCDLQHAATP